MELKFTVYETQDLDVAQSLPLTKNTLVSALSSKNVFAFVKVRNRPENLKHKIPIYKVCVVDLNAANEPHMIVESFEYITFLKFSPCGSLLLIVTRPGIVMMFKKGSAINAWNSCHISDWYGEHILHVDFFHNGIKTGIQTSDVKMNAMYYEKFILQPHKPTLTNFVNVPVSAYFAITASGLVLISIFNSNNKIIAEKKVVLGVNRKYIELATAAFAADGLIHIATWKPDLIKCWTLECSFSSTENISSKTKNAASLLEVKVQDGNSFWPIPCADQGPNASNGFKPLGIKSSNSINLTKLMFCEAEDPTNLLLLFNMENATPENSNTKQSCPRTYYIQRYQLQERNQPNSTLFGKGNSNGHTVKEWIAVGEWKSQSEIVQMSTCSRQLLASSQLLFIICASTIDGTIHAINKDTMTEVSSYNIQNCRLADESAPAKKSSMNKFAVTLNHTWTGLSIVAFDNLGNLYFLSLFKSFEIGQVWLMYILILFELALVSGHDWFDLLLAVPTTSINTIADRLNEMFNRHPYHLIQHLNTRFYVMKNSLYRLSSSLMTKSIETRLQAQLLGVLRLFRSLRPITNDATNSDKNVPNAIQNFIESRLSLDHLELDKAIDHLSCSSNILDHQIDQNLAKDLQPLLQFSIELSLYLMFMLTQNIKHEPSRDTKILRYLREILFISRMMHRHYNLVTPQVFKKTENVDIWSQLYKLLTRLTQVLPGDPDTSFLDECIVLESQVIYHEIPLFLPPRGVLGQIASSNSPSNNIQFQFNVPETRPVNQTSNSIRILDGALPAPHLVDPLYNHFLGVDGSALQNCTRCWGYRGSWWSEAGDGLWEQQWSHTCLCSGHWGPSYTNKVYAA